MTDHRSKAGLNTSEWTAEAHLLWLCDEHEKHGVQQFGGAEVTCVRQLIAELRALRASKFVSWMGEVRTDRECAEAYVRGANTVERLAGLLQAVRDSEAERRRTR